MKFGNQKIAKHRLVLIAVLAILIMINVWLFSSNGEFPSIP